MFAQAGAGAASERERREGAGPEWVLLKDGGVGGGARGAGEGGGVGVRWAEVEVCSDVIDPCQRCVVVLC